jgi:peptidoglycan/xylan/chitin deacetylase (PgdA/CDA1 family)
MMIISIDIDVGSKELGIVNNGKNDLNVNDQLSEFSVGSVEEMALPLFLDLFERFDHPVTFAIRGQWLDHPNDALFPLLSTSVQHDIGAHGYSHIRFKVMSSEQAQNELKKVTTAMKRYNQFPKSFVFPKNSIAHLDLLSKYGFRSYRGYGGILHDSLYIENHGKLWDVHPSLFIDSQSTYKLTRMILKTSMRRKLPLHLWFHMWNFGNTSESIQRKITNYFQPLLQYAHLQALKGNLDIETMTSAVEVIESGIRHEQDMVSV